MGRLGVFDCIRGKLNIILKDAMLSKETEHIALRSQYRVNASSN